jgi:hypothetical protein
MFIGRSYIIPISKQRRKDLPMNIIPISKQKRKNLPMNIIHISKQKRKDLLLFLYRDTVHLKVLSLLY